MKKYKRDYHHEPFVRIGREIILRNDEWHSFHARARDFYIMLKSKYNTKNNGEICLYYSEIRKMKMSGLSSKRGISAAIKELEDKGWIKRTQRGGLARTRSVYELTWKVDKLN